MRTINIGGQSYEDMIVHHDFYVDKTSFIREWWEAGDDVTSITRPRRFGKTLNMDMLKCFFSNRESGYGRYDIMMKPLKKDLPGIIIEFKVFDSDQEKTLEETAERALIQILEKKYDTELIAEGIQREDIIHYGMGFRGKDVVIRKG